MEKENKCGEKKKKRDKKKVTSMEKELESARQRE